MKIRCIALDLDRTTLNAQGCLSAENRNALQKAAQKGVKIVVASGRALSTLPEDIGKLQCVEYAVTSNGAAVYNIRTGECLQQYKMTGESVDRILQVTANMPVAYEAFIDGRAYAQQEYVEDPVRFGASVHAVGYIQGTRIPVADIAEFIKNNRKVLDSMDVVTGNLELKEELWKTFSIQVPDVYITSSVKQLLEISYKDTGKHAAVAFLLDYLGITGKELAAFGDGDNDAQMLAYAGVGIAMGNASRACREAADYITLSYDEDGVAYGIREILKL